jgi:membrane associated rhomboid family serine protease
MTGFSKPSGKITKSLILANGIIFAIGAIFGPGFVIATNAIFGLSSAGLADGWWWQLVTHQFLHGNGVHLLMNMAMLWFVGRDMEEVLGKSGFLALYFGGGVAGGLFQLPFLAPGGVLIGASGSVCAVLLALTTTFPRVPVTALIFFVIPVRMKAGRLGLVIVLASIVLWVTGLAPGIGHAAHLGGFVFGFLFALGFKWWQSRNDDRGTVPPDTAWNTTMDFDLPAATSRDEVVEKLLRHGLASLTKDEVKLLESPRPHHTTRWR